MAVMRKVLAWLGAAALVVFFSAVASASPTVLKPYVVLILDTSGSMSNATGSGPPSCGGADSKLNHARCAINNIANSYGDMVFAFGRFREIAGGTVAGTCPAGCTLTQDQCTRTDDRFQLMTGLVDGNNAETALWADFTCNTCTPSIPVTGTQDPEVWNAAGSTPLEGALKGAKDYWLGQQANPIAIAASPTGATEAGTTATFKTTAVHALSVGSTITVAGVGVAGYNGNFVVATVPTTTTFTVTGMPAGLAASGGGTVSTMIWSATAAGFAPIANDPTNSVFLNPPGLTSCNPNPATCDASVGCSSANCCCVSQCRPYITIMLTDGDETCGGTAGGNCSVTTATACFQNSDCPVGQTCVLTGTVDTAAASLLTTDLSNKRYRVITDPIGFGVAAGYGPLEAMAHAGGHIDVPGVNEAHYANDEAGLELAISQIIEGAIRSETCNGLDDDCDGLIDEDFPGKGNACTNGLSGVCAVAGTLVCKADGTGLVCSAGMAACNGKTDGTACTVTDTLSNNIAGTCTLGSCVPNTPPSTAEVCGNGIDDDCDGKVDEGCTVCIPTAEICNNKDDDCDGIVDEGITQQCGTGACLGTETCVAGVFVGCTAKTPTAEICNGLDDNCDGIADGFTVACSNLVTPGGPASDNPGDPSNSPIPQNVCHPGSKNCPVAPPGTGVFSACTGEAVGCNPTNDPSVHCDGCDGLDNDCDNKIDEDFVPASCSTSCGVGVTACVSGHIVCNSMAATTDNTCNGIDDDCDGLIDEDWKCDATPGCTGPNCCNCGTGTVCGGTLKCISGTLQCVGATINPEICNCLDDDCDGTVDEDVTCPSGSACVNCQCAFPCAGGEFPCPLGKKCDLNTQVCVTDPCYGVSCPPVSGNAQTCVENMTTHMGQCVDTCTTVTCSSAYVCNGPTGVCIPNDCRSFGCPTGQQCISDGMGGATCAGDPCAGVTCTGDQYCLGGNCITSCADVTCPTGKHCEMGACVADPCGHACPFGQTCNMNDNTCVPDPCANTSCPFGQACNSQNGQCEADPCVGVKCPAAGQVCKQGSCYNASDFQPDGGADVHVTVGGGGCNSSGGGSGGSALLALAIAAVLRRRKRVEGGRS